MLEEQKTVRALDWKSSGRSFREVAMTAETAGPGTSGRKPRQELSVDRCFAVTCCVGDVSSTWARICWTTLDLWLDQCPSCRTKVLSVQFYQQKFPWSPCFWCYSGSDGNSKSCCKVSWDRTAQQHHFPTPHLCSWEDISALLQHHLKWQITNESIFQTSDAATIRHKQMQQK